MDLLVQTVDNRSWNYIKSYYEYYKIQDELNIKEAKAYGNDLFEIFINLTKKGEFKKLYNIYKSYNNIKKVLKINKFPFLKGSDLIIKDVINSDMKDPFFYFFKFYGST